MADHKFKKAFEYVDGRKTTVYSEGKTYPLSADVLKAAVAAGAVTAPKKPSDDKPPANKPSAPANKPDETAPQG